MTSIRTFALTAIAAASLASAGLARDAGERAPAAGASTVSATEVASAGRNATPRSGAATFPGSDALLMADASLPTGRNDCVRFHCGPAVN